MASSHISTLRLVGPVAGILENPADERPGTLAARSNFSAFLRASVDALIANRGEIRSVALIGMTTNIASGKTPKSVSMPRKLHAHYLKVSKKQGCRLSDLYNSALLSALT